MSKEHKQYLHKVTKRKIIIHTLQFSLLGFLLILWQVAADNGIINAFISSSPSRVLKTILSLHNQGTLYHHIWVTAYETIISFTIGTLIGLVIATLLWWFDILAKILDPYLTVLNSLPKVALGPIILIWCGANMSSIILMAMLVSVIVAILNVYQGFCTVDQQKLKLMKSFGANKWQICFYLIFPGSLKNIISTLKLNISMCLIGVIMGEFLVSKEGIGYLIMYGSQVFNLNLVISGVVLLAILATFFYTIVSIIEKKCISNNN